MGAEHQRRKLLECRESECENTAAGIKGLSVLRVWVCHELRKKLNGLVLSGLTTVLSPQCHPWRSGPSYFSEPRPYCPLAFGKMLAREETLDKQVELRNVYYPLACEKILARAKECLWEN